jgi:hypothetical protein
MVERGVRSNGDDQFPSLWSVGFDKLLVELLHLKNSIVID